MGKFSRAEAFGRALDAFAEGDIQKSKQIFEEFKTKVGAVVDVGGLQVRQQAQKLQEQRFGQVESPLARESIETSQQQRRLGEIKITEAERLRDENARLAQQAAEDRAEIERLRREQGTTPTRRRAQQAVQEQDTAIETSRVTGEFAEEEAESIIGLRRGQEEQARAAAKATETAGRGAESGIDRTRRILTELQYPKEKIDRIVEQQTFQEAKIRPTGQDLATDIIMLSKAIESINTRATVQEVVAASAQAGGVEANAAKWLADMLGGQDAVLTPEQRDAAASRLRQLRDELAGQHNAIPGVVPINLEPEPGQIPLDQAVADVEEIISVKQQRNETVLSPQEEESLRTRQLEIFIPIINSRLQSGAGQ
jgi:hypothetical protein